MIKQKENKHLSSFGGGISSHTFLLLAHYATFAYQDILYEYLTKRKAVRVTKFNLPLPELPTLKQIEITTTEKGVKKSYKKIQSFVKPPAIAYVLQTIQLLFIISFSRKTHDIVIAEDSLLATSAEVLRFFGKCKTVIFYSHGIDKRRFNNNLMNALYQRLDRFAAKNADYNWFLNKTFSMLRKNQGITENSLFWVPASVEVKTVTRKKNVFNHTIVFLGVVNKKNGADLLPAIIHKLKNKIPDVSLDIIGSGDSDDILKKEIKRLKLEKNIHMLGMKTFEDFSKILTTYSVGIAPYEKVFDTLTATSDSMKMRVYLAAGLPVVITNGFVFSDEIEKLKLGFAVDFKVDSFVDKLYTLLTDKKLNQSIRIKALAYSEKIDIINIYNNAFDTILSVQNR